MISTLVLASTALFGSAPPMQGLDETVAPAFEGIEWLSAPGSTESMADGLKRVTDSSSSNGMPKRPTGAGLEAWFGRVVLVLQLPNPFGQDEAVALAEVIGRANLDRGMVVAALPPVHEEDEDEAGRPRVSEDMFVGLAAAESPWRPGGGVHATVLGPSGERVGTVELPAGEDELIDLLHVALNRFPAPRLEADLPDPLRDAQADYFSGDWRRARKAADKVGKKAAKRDPDLAQAVHDFVQTIDAFEQDLKIQLVDADGKWLDLERLAAIAAAVESGFPKGSAAKIAKEIASRQKKHVGRAMAFAAAQEFVALLPERPVLFPERKSSKGKKYAKKLTSATRRAETFEGDVTRKARALLARYEGASR